MAKNVKATDGGKPTGVEAIRGNGYDPEHTQAYVDRIEEIQSEIDARMQKAKDDCAPMREDIAGIKKEAHDAGLPRKELNAIIAKRRLLHKADCIREQMDTDQQDRFDQLELALGMLPGKGSSKTSAASSSKNGVEGHA